MTGTGSDSGAARRSCLAVPASNPRFLDKATGLAADEVFLDLEDAVAPAAKDQARANAVAALRRGGWRAPVVAVRINDVTTPWAMRDVLDVVTGAGEHLDAVILPKVADAGHVAWLDHTLTQCERAAGLPVGAIGIEAQIETARGLVEVDAIAGASPRLAALVYGPADLMASLGLRTLSVGEQPAGYDAGDAYHYVLLRILVAARACGLQAIDGPFLRIRDADGFRHAAAATAALGYDGKWVLHPDQIDAANAIFAPRQEDYDRAERLLEVYEAATSPAGGAQGAILLDAEMVDEALRKMALVVAAKGRAAGLRRTPSP